ncbi:MAG: putative TIM-barrel fold metal-dependent hydrolase [Bryobacterales bacterium]|nr:putative TIM-barrel fold metal-dependent hydrolase [Bryobacterales bacterium]
MPVARRNFLTAVLALAAPATSARPKSTPSQSLRVRLGAAFQKTILFDSHEHFWEESQRVSKPLDFFSLASDYVIGDLTSAGLPSDAAKTIQDARATDLERWRAFEPYWKHARFTGYSRALRLAIRDLYGVEEISLTTLPKINHAIMASNRPGIYRRLVRDRSGIRTCVQDDYWNPAPVRSTDDLLVMARRFDRFIVPSGPADIRKLEELTDVSITSLPTLQESLRKSFLQNLEAGMVTVKVGLAYMRELHFREVEPADATGDFERLMKSGEKQPGGFRGNFVRPFRNLEDYMFHQTMQLADAYRIPVQVHTGIHAGNRGVVTNSRPTLLTNIFLLYPRISFDLFHISYPYQNELSALAKAFPNVYADFCWAHVISPEVARRTMAEFLDTVPVNKIFGFGGDYHYPELSYAHAKMARQNIADVLAGKVEDGACTEEEALDIGRLLLHDNAARFFMKEQRKE